MRMAMSQNSCNRIGGKWVKKIYGNPLACSGLKQKMGTGSATQQYEVANEKGFYEFSDVAELKSMGVSDALATTLYNNVLRGPYLYNLYAQQVSAGTSAMNASSGVIGMVQQANLGAAAASNDANKCPAQTLFQYTCPCCSAPPGQCSNLNMESRSRAKRRSTPDVD
jgi:hypothetical protein